MTLGLVYNFANWLASSYQGGSVAFSGDALLSPVGNRVCAKDLSAHSSYASSYETVEDVEHIIPLNEDFLILIDKGGRMYYINSKFLTVLAVVHLGGRVSACAVDEKGRRKVAVSIKHEISCWLLPSAETNWRFSRLRQWRGHGEKCRSLRFSPDGNYMISCGEDKTVRVWGTAEDHGFKPLKFVDPHNTVIAADFSEDMRHIVAVTQLGHIYVWRWHPGDPPEDAKVGVKRLAPPSDITFQDVMTSGWWETLPFSKLELTVGEASGYVCADYHRAKRLLVLGTQNGQLVSVQINLDEGADKQVLETARVVVDSRSFISSVKFNSDGEWVAAGLPVCGTLCVWEWRSASFIVKQAAVDPSEGGVTAVALQNVDDVNDKGVLLGTYQHVMAAGYGDGRVVIWDCVSGFEMKSFHEHSGPVTGLEFTNQQHTLISCSSVGEIRYYELLRMKCFRTAEAPKLDDTEADLKIPLGSLSVDGSGSLLCVGSQGSDCNILLYSIQTGQLMDRFPGHTSPIVQLKFNHMNLRAPGQLAAVCSDGMVCVWNMLERDAGGSKTILQAPGSSSNAGYSLAWNPIRHNELAVSTMGGQITLWNVDNEEVIKTIDGARDIDIGRESDQLTSNLSRERKRETGSSKYISAIDPNVAFNKIAYAGADHLICIAEKSAKACLYETTSCTLAGSFKLTHNRSLENLLRKLNAKNVDDADIDLSDLDADELERNWHRSENRLSAPGAKFGGADRLKMRKRFRIHSVAVTPDCQDLVFGTSHGACYYQANTALGQGIETRTRHNRYSSMVSFAPTNLDEQTTRGKFVRALVKADEEKSLKLALRINNPLLISLAYERIEVERIRSLCLSLDDELVPMMLNFIKTCLELHRGGNVNGTSQMAKIEEETGKELTSCSRMMEHHLTWLLGLLSVKRSMVQSALVIRPLLLSILKDLQQTKSQFLNTVAQNKAIVSYLKQHCASS